MVFQYSPSRLTTDLQSLPPVATGSVGLPGVLSDVVDEFADVALKLGWEQDIHDARVLARGVLETSTDVSQVYEAMVRLSFRTRVDV